MHTWYWNFALLSKTNIC